MILFCIYNPELYTNAPDWVTLKELSSPGPCLQPQTHGHLVGTGRSILYVSDTSRVSGT
jgi:hypothetical protein